MKRTHIPLGLITLTGIAIFFLTSFTGNEVSKGGNTPGNVSFTVRTVSEGGNYAPKHVLAIWVEYNAGFVKTRKAMANQRKQYLYTWKAASNYNVVDAITGPTLTSHTTHTVAWDCTDLSGNTVEDGNYTIWVEFTEKHAQGPLYSIGFTKGVAPQTINPPDETYFKDISLEYTPVVSQFAGSPTEICQGETVTFTDLSSGATSWLWNFGDGASPAGATTQGPHTITYNTNGPKTITLTVNGMATETKENYIVVYPVPVAGFTFETNGLIASFTNTSVNATSYQWDFGDGNTSSENNPQHTYNDPGTYTVSLTAQYIDCTNQISKNVVVSVVGTGETGNTPYFIVWPNPSDGLIFLNIYPSGQNIFIRGFNINGMKVIERNPTPGNMDSIIKLDLSGQPGGLYLLEINASGNRETRKILIK
ncbi:MAG: DUF2271 domain-containing protein [Bacteroidales bacterium]|nr:DUF2271 domain-containing protein [Bacteroidales bacterium]